MSASNRYIHEEQPEDGDLGLGHGCQPGGLPPFEMLRRHRWSNARRPSETTEAQDSTEIHAAKRPPSPLMRLTNKLGFNTKSKVVSQADDDIGDAPRSDTIALGTTLKQQKLMFHREMINIQRRRNVDLQQFGTSGKLLY